MEKNRSLPLQSKNIYLTIFAIAIPILIQQVTQAMQFMIDQFLLGKYDPSGLLLSVTGNVIQVITIFFFFFFSLGTGITTLIAQSIGAKKFDRAERLAESSFLFTSLFTLISFVLFVVFTKQIFTVMKVDQSLMDQAVLYGRIVSINLIFLGLEITAVSTLQAAGVTMLIMFVSIGKNIANVFLNILLIYGVWIFPEMGLAGAGIATVISGSAGSIIFFLFFLFSKGVPFRMTIPGIVKAKFSIYKEALVMGLPTAIESLLWKSGQIVIVVLINSIDKFAMGVYSVLGSTQFLVVSLYMGFARAALTLTGQAWGAKKYDTGIKRGFQCMPPALFFCVAAAVVLVFFPRQILSFFTENPDFISRGIPLLRILAITVFGQALNIVTGHAIRAAGDPRWMTFSQVWGTAFVIGVSSLMILVFDMGLFGLFLTVMADEWIRGIVNSIYLLAKKKNPEKTFLSFKKPENKEAS